MELRQLEYFLAVVEHGGVRRAATALRVAQPSLSDALRALEREAGVPIFHRVGRGVVLTSAGEALLGPARRALRGRAVALSVLEDDEGLAGGRLEIMSWSVVSTSPLSRYVAAFRRRYPRITVHISDLRDEDDPVAMLRDGRHEIALAYLPVHGHDLHVHELGRHELYAVVPPGVRDDLPDPVPSRLLDGLPTCTVPQASSMRVAVEQSLSRSGARTREAAVTAHRDALVPLAVAGVGVAFVSGARAERSRQLGLTVRRLDPPVTRAYALLHRGGDLSPAGSAFVEFALELAAADRAAGRA